jgi:hypothetical protein
MIYGYIRVSTDKQTTDNQRFEILKYADEKKLTIDEWIEETVSATRRLSDRKLGALLTRMQKNDILIVSELSRLGRSLMEVMSILHTLMEKGVLGDFLKRLYPLGCGSRLDQNVVLGQFRIAFQSGLHRLHRLLAQPDSLLVHLATQLHHGMHPFPGHALGPF